MPPRSPNLKAFVERFQGSVLRLHYRTAFRYRFYQNVDDIDGDLQGWLRYYNSSMRRGAWIDPGIKPVRTTSSGSRMPMSVTVSASSRGRTHRLSGCGSGS